MKNLNLILTFLFLITVLSNSCNKDGNSGKAPLTFSHTNIDIEDIPIQWINKAKENLHIAYGHTSHGSQIISGMSGLMEWKGELYNWHDGPTEGAIDIDDYFVDGDLGNPDRETWAARTRDYLTDNTDVNVVMWSWCGQVSGSSEEDINTYLNLMTELENDYPDINFVYMTGHLDGSGVEGNLNVRNEQIRKYCTLNNKILYDFADIESYDPDGNYYLDKYVDDGCYYDSDNNESRDANWAVEWQNSHTEDVDWYSCSSAHSEPLNANMKAYAAWNLWARLAGWSGH